VGYVLVRISRWQLWTKIGGISSIAVHPIYLHKGIGRHLMLAAIGFLEDAKVKAIDLEVNKKNIAALSLYHSIGFVENENLPDYYGVGEDGVRMRLDKNVKEKLSST
jgi:[ribosomal protein S18]-alanine N-acetyltransferase